MLVHGGAGLVGFLVSNGWGLALVDSGSAETGPAATALGWLVNYVLLQPLAYWIIEAGSFAWWTWAGLGGLLAVIAFNTLALATAVWALRRRLRRRLPMAGGAG